LSGKNGAVGAYLDIIDTAVFAAVFRLEIISFFIDSSNA
jgi:hypothetical protein